MTPEGRPSDSPRKAARSLDSPARAPRFAEDSSAHDSPVLRMVTRIATPLALAVSLIIFWQGHNHPGGGFIAGVMAAAAGAMYLLGFGAERAARFAWWRVAVVGVLIAYASGTAALIAGKPFLYQTVFHVPVIGHLPSTVFFDGGIYLIVVGTLMTIFVELARERL